MCAPSVLANGIVGFPVNGGKASGVRFLLFPSTEAQVSGAV
jgi:hypothetical protein